METIASPVKESIISRLYAFADQKKYELLLFSFLLLIFGNSFSDNLKTTVILDIYQNMIIGALVFYNRKPVRNIVFVLILLSLGLDLIQDHIMIPNTRTWHSVIYLGFFFIVSREVFKQVLFSRTVTRELLSAAMCGFVLLCLISTFLFNQIDIIHPHSFSNTGEGKEIMNNLNYFSFTTLLTVGYGDITPLTLVAKRAVMLMGLTGHFYTVFITSIIIGKYLSSKKG